MSKLGSVGHFFLKLGKIAPAILALSPLAPIAGPVALAIAEAEAIHGAHTGPEKLAHVIQTAVDAAKVANVAAGHQVVDPAKVASAATATIGAIIAVANVAE